MLLLLSKLQNFFVSRNMISSCRFLQKQNVRIFIGDFYSAVARRVFCAVSSTRLF